MTDWINEINLCMCYCIMINTTAFEFDSWGTGFNSVFVVCMGSLIFLWPFKVAYAAHKQWNAPLA